jgi:hypothetical protein
MQRVHHHEPKRKQELSLDLDEIVRQGPGGCSHTPSKPRSTPTS